MAEAFEDEGITIEEYFEELVAQEREDLMLGGNDGMECTYADGYIKRQAVFSCLTCVPSGNAGICTACYLSCHDGHEVVELLTKRKFRCDCGNSKFGVFSCKLCSNKEYENTDNAYNHNFKGNYCICVCPFPDLEAQEQFEIIQCCICEDWFHEIHLGLDSTDEIPKDEEEPLFAEFICQECSLSCSFLKLYPPSILVSENQKNESVLSGLSEVLEMGSFACSNPEDIDNTNLVSGGQIKTSSMHTETKDISYNKVVSQGECSLENFGLGEVKASCNKTNLIVECILGLDISNEVFDLEKKPMFLAKKWRDLLCRCFTCTNFYVQKGLHYLIDKEDSLEEYKKIAKQKREEKLQQEEVAKMDFLENLNDVQKIEFQRRISDFKTDLKNEFDSFLESHYDTCKLITPEDVQTIFENLHKKRKRSS